MNKITKDIREVVVHTEREVTITSEFSWSEREPISHQQMAAQLARLMYAYLPSEVNKIFFGALGLNRDTMISKIERLSATFHNS